MKGIFFLKGKTTDRRIDIVRAKGSTATKLRVSDIDPSIDNVDSGSTSSGRIIDVRSRVLVLVRDATETVRSSSLSGQSGSVHDTIFLNIRNLQ